MRYGAGHVGGTGSVAGARAAMSERGDFGWWLAVVLAIGAILFASLAFGAPNVGEFGLSWDNSAAIARSNAKVEMNRQDNITARRESDNWHATATTAVGWLAILGGIAVAGWSLQRVAVAWAARPHRPVAQPPPQIMVMAAPLLDAEPTAFLDWIDQDGYRGWGVKNPRTRDIIPLRLTDSQRSPPRR